MERDLALTKAAELEELGNDLGRRRPEDPEIVPRAELVAQVGRCLASARIHPVLVGESGVGKTSAVVALARAMAERAALAEPSLHGRRIVQVTPSELIAGALYANQLEHKVKLVADNCKQERAFLLLDDLPAFVHSGASSCDPDGDVSTLFAPFMRRGDMRIVATATLDGWMQVMRFKPGFARLLTPLFVPEPSMEETMRVLWARARGWESEYGVTLTRAALEEAIDLAERLYPWKRLPGKACALTDAALGVTFAQARLALGGPGMTPPPAPAAARYGRAQPPPLPLGAARERRPQRQLGPSEMAEAVRHLTGVPEFLLVPSRAATSDSLRAFFRQRVLGQEHVIEPLVQRIQMIKTGLCAPGRPLAAYLFAGPTGVGKTLVARSLAALLLGDERRLIRFDMSEFCAADSVLRFLGHDGGISGSIGLVDAALVEPFPVVLLDEIEKAHPVLFDALLQLLGEGRLTDPRGRTAHFTNALILLTSNLGADRCVIDFPQRATDNGAWEARVREALRQRFRPEFVNRLTAVFAFRPLGLEEIAAVARREIGRLGERKSLKASDIRIYLTAAAFQAVLSAGHCREFGARPMERAVDALVGAPVAAYLAERPGLRNHNLLLDVAPNGSTCVRSAEPVTSTVTVHASEAASPARRAVACNP